MQILNLGTVDVSTQLPSDLNVTEKKLEIVQIKLVISIDAESMISFHYWKPCVLQNALKFTLCWRYAQSGSSCNHVYVK